MITHPDKLLFPEDGITKGDLAQYYESAADVMLPHLRGRPVTLERYPSGIGRKGFWQKNVARGAPPWLGRIEVPKKDGTVRYAVIDDVRSLRWMANQNTITPHVWVSRVPDLFHPDVCVFDLDPPGDGGPEALRRAALGLRDLLEELGLRSWAKTSGSKGFHILLSLDGSSRTDVVDRFAHGVGALLVERQPNRLTQEFSKADRRGRIFVDTGRNGFGATFAAAYAVRARPGAPVSAPCSWEEIEHGRVNPRSFTLRTMKDRIAEVGDLWADMRSRRTPLRRAFDELRRRGVIPGSERPRPDD